MRDINHIPLFISLPCGSRAELDHDSGCGHRCENCFAIVGSIGQPQACKDAAAKYDNWEKLGGKGWNYLLGQEYE